MKNKYNRVGNCMLLVITLGFIITMWPQPGLGEDANVPLVTAEPETDLSSHDGLDVAGRETWAKYQIIIQRNIFSRQRGPVRQRQVRVRTRPIVTHNPESYFLLKGIVQEDGTFIAFLEDTQNNDILRLHEGDKVARGVIKNFTLDSIEYQLEQRTISVELGRDLEGGQGTLSMNRLLELSASSSLTSDPNAATKETILSGDEAEILRKLMEQRRQQIGQ